MSTKLSEQALGQLRRALFLISRGWSQGCAARNSLGEPCGSLEGSFWSLDAALYFREDYSKGFELGFEAETSLREVIGLKSVPEKKIFQGTVAWNDVPTRTKEEVLTALTKAILRATKAEI